MVGIIQGLGQLDSHAENQIKGQAGSRPLGATAQTPEGHTPHIFIDENRFATVLELIEEADDGRMV